MADHDPDTGEVYEERAADGGRRYPAANTLTDLVMMLRDGQFNADSAEKLKEFASKLEALGVDSGKKAKGKIVLTIDVDFDPDKEVSFLTPTLTFKLPAEKAGTTIAWFTDDHTLTPNKPRQGHLFGTIRQIDGEARTIRG